MSDQTHSTDRDPSLSFHGAYTRAVDAKGRFNLPFRFRLGTGDEAYMVSRGPDGNLAVHPLAEWEAIFQRMERAARGAEQRRNLRILSMNSSKVQPDAQGRIAVPTKLLEAVGIGRKVTVIGVGAYMELWDPETLEAGDAAAGEPDAAFNDLFFGGGS
jgi:MraZ protein